MLNHSPFLFLVPWIALVIAGKAVDKQDVHLGDIIPSISAMNEVHANGAESDDTSALASAPSDTDAVEKLNGASIELSSALTTDRENYLLCDLDCWPLC